MARCHRRCYGNVNHVHNCLPSVSDGDDDDDDDDNNDGNNDDDDDDDDDDGTALATRCQGTQTTPSSCIYYVNLPLIAYRYARMTRDKLFGSPCYYYYYYRFIFELNKAY